MARHVGLWYHIGVFGQVEVMSRPRSQTRGNKPISPPFASLRPARTHYLALGGDFLWK